MHVYADKTTKKLIRRGVFSVSTKHHDREAKTFKEHAPFSIPQAIGLAFLLSIFLYWLPIFGTMIAGYVCGRRAGTAVKGGFCGLIAGFILFIIGYIIAIDAFSAGTALHTCQNAIWNWIQTANPIIASYFLLIANWAEIITGIFRSFLLAEPGNIVILVVFGYVGGAIAAQRYRECTSKPHYNYKPKETHTKHWKFFKAKAEPKQYYYVKAEEQEEAKAGSERDEEEFAEPRVQRPQRLQTKQNEVSLAENTFSDDEYYILGMERPAVEPVNFEPHAEKSSASKRRGVESLIERAMKARNEEMKSQSLREQGVL